ncbi:MAG: acyl-[Lachnospiraceae bacterium]|nr:acyl-[acyl-carrier-protein] thioesterase [Lachnospiraceae bacterium]MBQ3905634.1 acyl-[acyl-carrier-protein] thioesterase [Lachnospiraceae bacterium]
MYKFDSRIRYSETDSEGNLTMMALLNYFQDCSTFQSEDAGVGIRYCLDRDLVWVLNSWQIVPIRLPKLGEKVTIATCPYDFQKFMGYRNFMMFDEAGNYLAKANSIWSLINLKTGRFEMPDDNMLKGYPVEERIPMEYAGRKISVPAGGEMKDAITVLPHHLDANHHVNNGQYVAMAFEFLPEGAAIKQLRAEYRKQAFLGNVLIPYVVAEDTRIVVSLQDDSGKAYAVVEFEL